jgi:hypothetical protein
MKTLEEIIASEPTTDYNFIMEDFEATQTDEKILFATYVCESYEGYAYALFVKDGKLYEVEGSHCSCYGLEDQWTPIEVCLPELVNRVTNGKSYGLDDYGSAVRQILGID